MSDPNFERPQAAVRPAGQTVQSPKAPGGRLGPRFGRIDPDAIAKAEQALRGLSSQFGQWLQDEVGKLQAARAAIHADGFTQETVGQVYIHAHDLKGLGATYEFPIVTQIAGSLCKLLSDADRRLDAPLALIEAHVDAVVAMVRDNIKTSDDPAGRAVVHKLEAQVQDHLRKA